MNRCRLLTPPRCLLGLAFVLCAPVAHAVLGAAEVTVQDDQARLHGMRRQALAVHALVTTHEITMSDGSSIREFVGPSGVVFAVAWSTRFKPNLQALLGQHAVSYNAAAADALRVPGIKRSVVLQRGDLVVHSAGHLTAFVGKAYLASQIPEGVRVDDLH